MMPIEQVGGEVKSSRGDSQIPSQVLLLILYHSVLILILSVAQEQKEEREEESEARHFIDVYLAEMEKNPKDFSFEELCRFEVFIAPPLPSS